ncbi:MAG: hypothetical protein KDD19_05895 [Phaeodactylibacter sp.]|nr:hypothetical protein [Phaeodactylibacter sp.]MCB9048306.1 hypothetical protein [Lewinellaceae bacterium]
MNRFSKSKALNRPASNISARIPFGLRGHQLLSIEEAPRGLACDCLCPACGAQLVAKKGARHAHHFAHYRGSACPDALETGLHLKAKEVFERLRRVAVPAVCLYRQTTPVFEAQLLRFDRVRLEQHLGKVVPDIVLESGSKRLLIEIGVSHHSGKEKIRKLKKLGLSAIEIDALAIYRQLIRDFGQFRATAFEQELVQGLEHKRWLFNDKQQRIEYKLRRQSAERPAQHRYFKGFHSYIVPGCPLEKRRWRSGFREGECYASLWQDCLYCHRCFEVIYERAVAGFEEVAQHPVGVRCWGHLPLPRAVGWASSI